MDYDQLFDKLCDLIVASGSTPQTATLALVGCLHAVLSKLDTTERERWFDQIKRMRQIHNETFGAVVKPEQNRVH